uniref:Uncharacterized protein n=1 Tax=Anguilla anguilla TaxID=7936 RepID=A0A0E9UTT2_ANGAN
MHAHILSCLLTVSQTLSSHCCTVSDLWSRSPLPYTSGRCCHDWH